MPRARPCSWRCARSLAKHREKLPRRIVFVAFSGEEAGILGSNHYVQHPLVPLEKTIAMVNLDMVGRLREDRVTVMGSDSGKQFAALLDDIGRQEGLKLTRLPGGPGPSDQMAFHGRNIPSMHFYTGMHGEYHRTTDTFETLNVPGMRRMAALVERVVVELAKTPGRPEFVKTSSRIRIPRADATRPFFGIAPEFCLRRGGFCHCGGRQRRPGRAGRLAGGRRGRRIRRRQGRQLRGFRRGPAEAQGGRPGQDGSSTRPADAHLRGNARCAAVGK